MKKYMQGDVEQYFSNEGYTILGEYKDCRTKIAYRCPEGHESAMSFDNFKRGKRCPACRLNEASERYRHSYDYVKEEFSKAGCLLLNEKYINGKQKLDYVCSCGNKASIRFEDFKNGKRCGKCAMTRR